MNRPPRTLSRLFGWCRNEMPRCQDTLPSALSPAAMLQNGTRKRLRLGEGGCAIGEAGFPATRGRKTWMCGSGCIRPRTECLQPDNNLHLHPLSWSRVLALIGSDRHIYLTGCYLSDTTFAKGRKISCNMQTQQTQSPGDAALLHNISQAQELAPVDELVRCIIWIELASKGNIDFWFGHRAGRTLQLHR